MSSGVPSVPGATYRLQFSADFGLDDARRIVPYLSRLGITHIYASPLTKARPGSAHGYDVVDQRRVNPEIGGEEGLDRLVETLHRHGMGIILDFVPNHMGIGSDNPWWVEVLEWGKASPRAGYFDIDWQPLEPALQGKLLLPVLGDHYGAVLERGELALRFDAEAGGFGVHYWDKRFPIAPADYPRILWRAGARSRAAEVLAPFADRLTDALKGRSGRKAQAARRQEVEEVKRGLAQVIGGEGPVHRAVLEELDELNGREGDPGSFDALHALLDRQRYRLAFWRVAAYEINYRRFFDIDELAGLRMEDLELFEAGHELVRRLLESGRIQGLRLDHVDGLREPGAYFDRLRDMGCPYLLVEKILAPHESLPADWAVDGTTGYGFMAAATGLFVDPSGERALDRAYGRFVDGAPGFAETAVEAKRLIMREVLVSELNVLANRLHRIARQSRMTRDYTLTSIRTALADVVAHFRVYRTYVTAAGAGKPDRHELEATVERARSRSRQPDTSVYAFILDVLTLDLTKKGRGYRRREVIDAALRFQQYTGPVMAKSFEDTAFYRYFRLVALNEVGGVPDRFGVAPADFHRDNLERLAYYPTSMVATATHDHKRGEDVRARLTVLSEIPREWARITRKWARMNRRKKQVVEGRPAPDANDEYLLYQTLVGAWPTEPEPPDLPSMGALLARIDRYMLKALRESKRRTSWLNPDEGYEAGMSAFVAALMNAETSPDFLEELHRFAHVVAPVGAVNGLAQLVLRLTSPGMPDTYQGTEMWDLSLVDPDNRSPVDFVQRLASLESDASPEELMGSWWDGRIKQMVMHRILSLRRREPALFREGSYEPLASVGPHAGRIFAFGRATEAGDRMALVVVPRLVAPLLAGSTRPLPRGWEDTAVRFPNAWPGGRFADILTGVSVEVAAGGLLPADRLLARLPVAVLAAGVDR